MKGRDPMKSPVIRGTLVLAIGVLLAQPGCSAAEDRKGRVTVRVTDHRAGIGDFTTLEVQFAEISLHRGRASRWTGWVELLRDCPAVDIVPLKEGRWARVGANEVPGGRYDAMRVRFGAIQGRLRRGGPPTMAPIETTIAIDLEVRPDSGRAVLIDLYVEDQTDHQPGLYAVKVHDVTVGEEGQ